jgi:uncharacterized protein YcsI (UPF0317 family)
MQKVPNNMPNNLSPVQLRRLIRNNEHIGATSGFCKGYVQCNMVILPEVFAEDFRLFCRANPKPCPLIAVSKVGEPHLAELGQDLDVRTDLSSYRLFENGQLTTEMSDISALWDNTLVAFLIGCSFSFEDALIAEGLEVRNISQNRNVPMYRTNIDCTPAGPFNGKMVVSMRPFNNKDTQEAIQVTGRFPSVHGAPIHFGDPKLIGIKDINKPDYGDAVRINNDEQPVFWACGVTPQVALEQAKLPFCITHSPGCMLVTDILNSTFDQR